MFKGTKNLVTITRDNLSLNQKRFFAEVIGTFIVVVLAIGSVVIDAKLNGILGVVLPDMVDRTMYQHG